MRLPGCLLLALVATGVGASSPALEDGRIETYEPERLLAMSATEFLAELCSYPQGHVFIRETVPGWPTEADLPALRLLAQDAIPCRSVAHARSSYLDDGRSTRGIEATFLILGIRAGAYPPGLNSTRIRKDVGEALRRAERVSNGAEPPPR